MSASADVVERVDMRPVDSDDHEVLTHIITKKAQDEFWLTGKPVTALCGKTWAPVRDPERFPPCKTCEERLNALLGR